MGGRVRRTSRCGSLLRKHLRLRGRCHREPSEQLRIHGWRYRPCLLQVLRVGASGKPHEALGTRILWRASSWPSHCPRHWSRGNSIPGQRAHHEGTLRHQQNNQRLPCISSGTHCGSRSQRERNTPDPFDTCARARNRRRRRACRSRSTTDAHCLQRDLRWASIKESQCGRNLGRTPAASLVAACPLIQRAGATPLDVEVWLSRCAEAEFFSRSVVDVLCTMTSSGLGRARPRRKRSDFLRRPGTGWGTTAGAAVQRAQIAQ